MIDSDKPLSRSLLWDIQRRYFEDQGIEAWRGNIVPSYITSNPHIAHSYARVVIGYLRDHLPALDPSQPVYIVELGAGGGRFGFYFMRSFISLLEQSPFPDLNFCYVLTDLPELNVQFWQEHPSFQEWIAAGKLDFARFDAGADSQIALRHAGQTITAGSLKNPLIFIANYFFDSIPQDVFHIEEGMIKEVLINLTSHQPEPDPTVTGVLPRLMIHFRTQESDTSAYYHDSELDSILEQYRGLENSYLLFPADGIRLMRGLIDLTGGRMLMLCGDFGLWSKEEWDHNGSPDVRIHGSISMEVNFHALGAFVQNQDGAYLAPSFHTQYLTACAFLIGETPGGYTETRLAFTEAIDRGGPNDFFLVKRGAERAYTVMTLSEMLGFIRFSGWDPHLFLDAFDDLLEKIADAGAPDRKELARAVQEVWANYYHLGEARDLPFNLGIILFRLGLAKEALPYFNQSLAYYGPSPVTLYNLALCQTQLREFRTAWSQVKKALLIDPAFEPALALEKELLKNQPGLKNWPVQPAG